MRIKKAIKKIEIAIDKVIDLEDIDLKTFEKIGYKREQALEALRDLVSIMESLKDSKGQVNVFGLIALVYLAGVLVVLIVLF